MPKQKTRKSILKRIKITKNGKVFRGNHGTGHRKAHKTKSQLRNSHLPKEMNIKQAKRIKSLINK